MGDLREPRSIVVSPDGNNVYVAAGDLNGVVVFQRDSATGVLSYVETKLNGHDGVPASALGGATSLAISADGKSLYVAGAADSAVAALQRNLQTGTLTFAGVQLDNAGGIDGLEEVRNVSISPDGKFVYAVSNPENSVVVFQRNATDSTLTFVDRTTTGSPGFDQAHALPTFTPTATIMSADGALLYAAGGVGDIPGDVDGPDATIAVFQRNQTTGKLLYLYDAGGNHLGGAGVIALSPNSLSLYATTQLHASVGFYSVNP
jgi:6-phosphogluconolactonase (cycloisomerase 2 family)